MRVPVEAANGITTYPWQVEAANGLKNLIEIDGTEAVILPILPDLLNEFFRIMSEIGSDSVVASLEVSMAVSIAAAVDRDGASVPLFHLLADLANCSPC